MLRNMKRVFIIHGWTGKPEGDWFPWLKQELETKGFQVQIPEMPDTEKPKKVKKHTIKFWMNY